MDELKYPFYSNRMNCFAGTYCEIAMESYYEAFICYDDISENDFSGEKIEELLKMEKAVVKTIVFSAMCIESFLNDYGASCLGDSEFYGNFDKLNPLGKFQLISKFILKKDIEKDKSCYSLFKDLFHLRNEFVHNKSKESDFHGFSSLEECVDFYQGLMNPEEILEIPPIDKLEADSDMRKAFNSLKAIYELMKYFDENDSCCFAVERTFRTSGILLGSEREKEYKKYIFSKLNMKIDDRYLM